MNWRPEAVDARKPHPRVLFAKSEWLIQTENRKVKRVRRKAIRAEQRLVRMTAARWRVSRLTFISDVDWFGRNVEINHRFA